MRLLDRHPLKTLGGLLLLAFVLFMLSGVFKESPEWLGDICWFGWMVAFLAFLLGAGWTVVRRARRSTANRSAA